MKRLSDNELAYLKIALTMPAGELVRWLFPAGLFRPSELEFPTEIGPMICARCGMIHGECLGGKVWDNCPACATRPNYPDLAIIACVTIRARFSQHTYAEWPEFEVANILKEVFKHERHGVLQYADESARERVIHYSQS